MQHGILCATETALGVESQPTNIVNWRRRPGSFQDAKALQNAQFRTAQLQNE